MSNALPDDLDGASVDALRAYARKVQSLWDTRGAVIAALRDDHGKSWPEIDDITGWPATSVRRWYHEFKAGEQK